MLSCHLGSNRLSFVVFFLCVNLKLQKMLAVCSKCGGLCAVGVPLPNGRANHPPHLHPCPPKEGPRSAVFSAPNLRPPAGWLVALLLLSGDVERNHGPSRRWQCALCSQYIKTKSQTSICCNHTTTHWVTGTHK